MKCIVLLHGFLSEGNDFLPIIAQLEKYYNKVELLCFPGHGKKFGYEKFNKENVFSYLDEVFSSLVKEYNKIDVMGFSMGGALSLYVATKYKINRLILLAPAFRYFNLTAPFARAHIYLKTKKMIRKNKKRDNLEYVEKMQGKLQNIIEDDKKSIRYGMRIFLKKILPKYFSEFTKIIKELDKMVTTYDVASLILWGELDQLVPRKSVDEVFSLCTNTDKRLIIYDDITHLMLLSTNNQKIIDDIILYLEEDKEND